MFERKSKLLSCVSLRVMSVQYMEGVQYRGGHSVKLEPGMSSVQWRDKISTVDGYHQYRGGNSVQCRDIISTVQSLLRTDDIPTLY